jgi:hypothetical protein
MCQWIEFVSFWMTLSCLGYQNTVVDCDNLEDWIDILEKISSNNPSHKELETCFRSWTVLYRFLLDLDFDQYYEKMCQTYFRLFSLLQDKEKIQFYFLVCEYAESADPPKYLDIAKLNLYTLSKLTFLKKEMKDYQVNVPFY